MKPVRFHGEARAELRFASDYYEARSRGLGARFLDEVARAVAEIRRLPRQCPVVAGEVRRKVLKAFPFALLYSELADQILVLAVMHQHREPTYWTSRH